MDWDGGSSPDGCLALLSHPHGLQHPLQSDVHLGVATANRPVAVVLLFEVPRDGRVVSETVEVDPGAGNGAH